MGVAGLEGWNYQASAFANQTQTNFLQVCRSPASIYDISKLHCSSLKPQVYKSAEDHQATEISRPG
jgi:hypothetical protein